METDGEGGEGGGEAARRGRSELGRLLEAIESSEALEKRIPLIKQLEDSYQFSADDLGLILQSLLASWIDSTCSGVSHCTLHRSILQVALKCSDLDITDYLGQFLILGAKASSWCGKHLQSSVKCVDESQVVQEEEHNRLRLEINSLSFSISTKLLGIESKCFTALGLEVAAREGWQRAAQEECVLNKTENAFPTLESMAAEVEPVPTHLTVGMRRGSMATWSLAPVLSPPPQEVSRRCTHCTSEKTSRWRQGPDGPGTLCNACGQRFKKGRLLQSNSRHCRGRCLSSMENSAAGNVVVLVEALPCGIGASLDAFFDQTGSEVPWKEAGPERAEEEEELEWLSNKDAFPSVETMALEVEVKEACALETPGARTKGRRRVTAMETTCRQANVPRAEKPQRRRRRCTHCATESTPEWRQGPEGRHTLCNACGLVFRKKGRLLAEYRPANSPAFSPLLHSNKYTRALEMHRRNETTSACHGEVHGVLMDGQLPPPANGPTSSSPLPLRLVLSEEGIAVIRTTVEARRAERAAAFLAAMDN